MPLVTKCARCQRPLQVPDDAGGKQVRCPHCKQVFVVPAAPARVGPAVATPVAPGSPRSTPVAHAPGSPRMSCVWCCPASLAIACMDCGCMPWEPDPVDEQPEPMYQSRLRRGNTPQGPRVLTAHLPALRHDSSGRYRIERQLAVGASAVYQQIFSRPIGR